MGKFRSERRGLGRPWLAFTALLAIGGMALASCSSSGSTAASNQPSNSSNVTESDAAPGSAGGDSSKASAPVELTVWADPPRATMFQQYQKENPDVKLKIETIPGTPEEWVQKIQLANKAGSGWPDLIAVTSALIDQLNTKPLDFAADISKYVPADTLAKFSSNIKACESGSAVICLPNEVSPSVLFYNKPLMKEYGYAVPTTWEQYEQIGEESAKDHPGHPIGHMSLVDTLYYQSGQCPMYQLEPDNSFYSNLSDPNCTKMTTMLDNLMKVGAIPNLPVSDPQFVKKYGATNDWLMAPCPIWCTVNDFKNLFKTPAGHLGVALLPHWDGQPTLNGSLGGQNFMVSRHSKNIEAAAKVALGMASGPIQENPETVTVPSYQPAQSVWVETQSKDDYLTADSGDLATLVKTASSQINPNDYTPMPQPELSFGTTVLPAVQKGDTIASQMANWQSIINKTLQAAGFQVSDKPQS